MKTTLKYIALLIFSGVIIPLYQHPGALKTTPVNCYSKISVTDSLMQRNNVFHLYFLHDIAAKLLPIEDIF